MRSANSDNFGDGICRVSENFLGVRGTRKVVFLEFWVQILTLRPAITIEIFLVCSQSFHASALIMAGTSSCLPFTRPIISLLINNLSFDTI